MYQMNTNSQMKQALFSIGRLESMTLSSLSISMIIDVIYPEMRRYEYILYWQQYNKMYHYLVSCTRGKRGNGCPSTDMYDHLSPCAVMY